MNIVEEQREKNLRFEIGASSIIGTRGYQQDYAYFYTDSDEVLAIVCDGMGGLEGGERASRTAVEQMVREFHSVQKLDNAAMFFKQTAQHMDQAVCALKGEDGKPLHAGTTLVAVYCKGSQMYWVSVGDSRIYLLRDNEIMTINREHNYRLQLKMQLDAGLIDWEFYQKEEKTPKAEALISFIGMDGVKYIDVNMNPIELQRGDIIMLCSDGIYKSLSDSQVCAMIRDNDLDMNIAADRTTAMALRYGVRGQDNTTVILLSYQG